MPIFLLIAIGAAAARARLVTQVQIEGLAVFVLHFALPALIVDALMRQDLSRTFDLRYVAAYGGGSLVAFCVVFFGLRNGLGEKRSAAAIGALGGATSNTGFIGFPVASLAFGSVALTALPLNLLVENFLVIPLALALAESGRQGGRSPGDAVLRTLKALLRMPIILAIVLGAVLSLLRIHLPAPVATTIGMLSKASAPCALFVVGGTIGSIQAGGLGWSTAWIVVSKLVLHPLAVAVIFFLIGGVPPELMKAGILMAGVSMITVYPIIGGRFGERGASATAMVVATALAFFTLTAMLGVLQR